MKRLFLILLSGFCLLAQATGAPNIVLIVTDDLSLTAGCYGTKNIRTPHLDSLAKEGTLFKNAYATTASCSASRSVLLTGLHNHLNGQYGHSHPPHHFAAHDWVLSLPTLLKRGGYHTANIGKTHTAPEEVFRFERTIPADCRNTVLMAEKCLSFLQEQSSKAPFFLYFCPCDPHRSGVTQKKGGPDLFGNERTHAGVEELTYRPEDVEVPPFLPDNAVTRAELAQYYQSISRLDQGIGRLIKHLKQTGHYENTLLVFTSDNGMAFAGAKTTTYESGLRVPLIIKKPGQTKGEKDDSIVSLVDLMPTLLEAAGLYTEGEIHPSVLKQAAFPNKIPYRLHGRSIWSGMGSASGEKKDFYFASHTFHEVTMYYPMRVVRKGRFKLIWNLAHSLPYPFASDLWESSTWQQIGTQGMDARYGLKSVREYIHRPRFELFDLQSDPQEQRNLADKTEYESTLNGLKAELKIFQEETQDPWMTKWQYE